MYKTFTKKVYGPPPRTQKILRIMKLTTFIILIALMQVSASTVAQRLTIADKTTTLKQLFNQINQQTGYNVVWSASQVNGNRVVPAGFNNTPLLEVLNTTLANTNLSYTIEDKTVVIKEKEQGLTDKIKSALNIAITLTGKVQDETRQPLPGVTVKIKGSNLATSTDEKGDYTLTVPDEKTTITFSFIGYETQEYLAKDIPEGTTITLKASTSNLREVVVNQGYYTRKQELNTGNVTRIDGADIAKQPGIDPIEALEGRVPGLYIQQSSGIPGSNPIVRLRGQNSIANGNDPLYIVDGVPFTSTSLTSNFVNPSAVGGSYSGPGGGLSPFNTLDPANIESIEILKDADATAIYGSRGANGVILITTKKGKPGKTIVDVSVAEGSARVASTLSLMNTQQYLTMRHQAFKNDGKLPGKTDYDVNGTWDTTRYTNWEKVLIGGTAHYTNVQGSISRGTANTQFNVGGSYNRQTTVFPGDYSDKRGSAHFSLTHVSTDQKFHANFSASYANENNVIPLADFTGSITLAPDAPALYNPDGTINFGVYPGIGSTFGNPLARTLNTAISTSDNLNSNLVLYYELFPGLIIKSSMGYNRMQMNQTDLTLAASFNGAPNPYLRSNDFGTTNNNTWILEPQIDYQRKIGKGKFDVLIGMTHQQIEYNSIGYDASNFTTDALISNPAFASTLVINGNNTSQYKYSAIYGRMNYNWEDKYLLNFTARRDGSSRFGPGRQFGDFGAVGAGWIFSKEKWAR